MKNYDVSGQADEHEEEIIRRRIAEVIKRRRNELRLSQEDLAEKAKCHRNTIGFIERAEKTASIYLLFMVALALDTTASEILKEIEA